MDSGCWGAGGDGTEAPPHSPTPARRLTLLLSVWFAVYEVSPTPPITVTHKPEEDTFGVSDFWVGRGRFHISSEQRPLLIPPRSEPGRTYGRKSPDE